jgi:hypothetical protein
MSAVDGAIAWAMQVLDAASAAVVDMTTGATLGAAGDPALRAESVSAAGTAMVLAGLHVSRRLGVGPGVPPAPGASPPPEDLLISAGNWFHLIRPVYAGEQPVAFIHVLLERARTNLALARRELAQLTAETLSDVVTAAATPVAATPAAGADPAGWAAGRGPDPHSTGWAPEPAVETVADIAWHTDPAALPGPGLPAYPGPDQGWAEGGGDRAAEPPGADPPEPGRFTASSGRPGYAADPPPGWTTATPAAGQVPPGDGLGSPAGGLGATAGGPGPGGDDPELPAVLPRRRPNTTWPGGRPVDADPRLASAGVAILDQVVREPAAPLDDSMMRRLAAALRRL